MEFKNVIFAIVLSFAVLLSWSLFFETPQVEKQNENQQTEAVKKNNTTSSDVPTVNTENVLRLFQEKTPLRDPIDFILKTKMLKGQSP